VSKSGHFKAGNKLKRSLRQFYAENGRGKVAQSRAQPHDEQRGVVLVVHLRHALDWILRLHESAHGTYAVVVGWCFERNLIRAKATYAIVREGTVSEGFPGPDAFVRDCIGLRRSYSHQQ
jgi:hypothetical protein